MAAAKVIGIKTEPLSPLSSAKNAPKDTVKTNPPSIAVFQPKFLGKSLNAIHNPQNAKPIMEHGGRTPSNNTIQPILRHPTIPVKPEAGAAAATTNQKPQKRTSKTPIIIIPASGTALVTMYNVVDILQVRRSYSSNFRLLGLKNRHFQAFRSRNRLVFWLYASK